MQRRLSWLAIGQALLVVLAVRLVYQSWSYYFSHSPRYRVESAAIAFVLVGLAIVVSRPGRSSHKDPKPEPVRLPWLPLFLLAAAAVYGPALDLGLLSDDFVLRNAATSPTLGIGSGWFVRPIPLVLWRLLLGITTSEVPFHLVNLLLHGLNAFLVAALGTSLGLRRTASLAGGALFLTFPASPEAVAWASGIQDVLMTTAALSAVLLAQRDPLTRVQIFLACAALVVGLGSKETAICIPVLIVLCRTHAREVRSTDAALYLSVFGILAAYGAIRLSMGIGSGYLVAPSRYFLKQLLTLAFGTLVAPWRWPSPPPADILGFIAVAGFCSLLAVALLTLRRGDAAFSRAARLAVWVCTAVAPVFTYFFVSPTLEGSRYVYLASAGWALLVADLIWWASDFAERATPWPGLALAAIVTVSSTFVLRGELRTWQRASQLRDVVLAEARRSIGAADCWDVVFLDVPDSVEGAYVFRNGLREAVGGGQGQTKPAGVTCALQWDGERFVRQP
jgi:hypothetical protein